jgi:hypothetical protein
LGKASQATLPQLVGKFVDCVHHIHRLRTGETCDHVNNQKRRIASEAVFAFVAGLLVHPSFVFGKERFPFSHD